MAAIGSTRNRLTRLRSPADTLTSKTRSSRRLTGSEYLQMTWPTPGNEGTAPNAVRDRRIHQSGLAGMVLDNDARSSRLIAAGAFDGRPEGLTRDRNVPYRHPSTVDEIRRSRPRVCERETKLAVFGPKASPSRAVSVLPGDIYGRSAKLRQKLAYPKLVHYSKLPTRRALFAGLEKPRLFSEEVRAPKNRQRNRSCRETHRPRDA